MSWRAEDMKLELEMICEIKNEKKKEKLEIGKVLQCSPASKFVG